MPFPSPNCPRCHGAGEIEHWTLTDGNTTTIVNGNITKIMVDTLAAISYEPCPCTFRSQWVDEEDWTNDRRTSIPS